MALYMDRRGYSQTQPRSTDGLMKRIALHFSVDRAKEARLVSYILCCAIFCSQTVLKRTRSRRFVRCTAL